MTDFVIEAGLGETIVCYDDLDIIKDAMPEFKDMRVERTVTDMKKLFYAH